MSEPHTITTADGRVFSVDEYGNMQARETVTTEEDVVDVTTEENMFGGAIRDAFSRRYFEMSNDWHAERERRIHSEHPIRSGRHRGFYISDPIENFDVALFRQSFMEYTAEGIRNISAHGHFLNVIRRYRRVQLESGGSFVRGVTHRVRVNDEGTWSLVPSNRSMRRERRTEEVTLPYAVNEGDIIPALPETFDKRRALLPKTCLHKSCIHCNGTRLVGGRRVCAHTYSCNCINCYEED